MVLLRRNRERKREIEKGGERVSVGERGSERDSNIEGGESKREGKEK